MKIRKKFIEFTGKRSYNNFLMQEGKVLHMQQQCAPAAVDARHPQERRAFLYIPLLALLNTVVIELFNHKAFTEGLDGFFEFVTE